MTDKPSAESSGDAEFQRWFAEQDPFGNAKAEQNQRTKTAKKGVPATGVFRFGIALPVIVVVVVVLTFAFVAGWAVARLRF
jgi:hypothetical protein